MKRKFTQVCFLLFQTMLNTLKDKRDSGFFTSISGLMSSCTVLDLDAFERNTKAEGLGVGPDGPAGEQNMHDADFTTLLFRFLQLTSEGHNNGNNNNNSNWQLFCALLNRINPVFMCLNFRLAKLPSEPGWQHHDGELGNLHRGLPLATAGVHDGLLLVLLSQGCD